MPLWAWIVLVVAVLAAMGWLFDRRERRRSGGHAGDGGSRRTRDHVDWSQHRSIDSNMTGGAGG